MLPSGQPQSRVCRALRKGLDRLPWGPQGSGCSWEEVSCLGREAFQVAQRTPGVKEDGSGIQGQGDS